MGISMGAAVVLAGLPLGALGIGSGWALCAVVVLMIFRGDLRTPREAKAQDRRIEALERNLETKDKTIAEFTAASEVSNELIRAMLRVSRERSETP